MQFKVKHRRTADCVVAGFRMHKDGDGVGSLLLGLYDDEHRLHHVGVASSFTARRRKELLGEVGLYLVDSIEDHPVAGVGRGAGPRPADGAPARRAAAAGTPRRT